MERNKIPRVSPIHPQISPEKSPEEANFFSYLPEDVFAHILLKLPIKSLLSCTCVSKFWNSFIKSPEFFSSHLNLNISSLEKTGNRLCLFQLSLPVETGKDSFFLRSNDKEFSVCENLHFPYRSNEGFQIVASCNGLVYLMQGKYNVHSYPIRLILWNPVIRKSMIINKRQNLNALEAAGLGFDSRNCDYKVLTLIEEPGNQSTLMVNLYSLKANSWKQLTGVEAIHDRRTNVHRAMTFLNGALYFVATRWRKKPRFLILGFDLSDEVFSEIMLPDCMVDESSCHWFRRGGHYYLSTYGESLAVLWLKDSIRVMEIWVMKELGVEGSWTRLSMIRLDGLRDTNTLAITGFVFREDEHVLLSVGSYENDAGRVFLHDLKKQETKEIRIPGEHACFFLGDFVESLVLLAKGNELSRLGDAGDTSGNNSSRLADFVMGASSHVTSSRNATATATDCLYGYDVSWNGMEQ